ncbi:MAG TPA: hypothetical protein VLI88_05680, partial [Patescibacteria group bacterium]|nr:hypothetical protein [Patescibacteria group bacterium]
MLAGLVLVEHRSDRRGVVREQAAQLRAVAAIAYACDLTVLVVAMFLFSSDPGWVTYLIAMVVIITGAFRFGTVG